MADRVRNLETRNYVRNPRVYVGVIRNPRYYLGMEFMRDTIDIM